MKALLFLKVFLLWSLAVSVVLLLVLPDSSRLLLKPLDHAEEVVFQTMTLFRFADQWNCVVITLLISLSVIILCLNDFAIAACCKKVTQQVAVSFWLSGLWWLLKSGINVVLFTGEIILFSYLVSVSFSSPRILSPADVPNGNYTVLLLGTSKYLAGTKKVNAYYEERINTCLELYHRGLISELVISGDSSSRWYDEVTWMEIDLYTAGFRGLRITRDKSGYRTFDSIKRLRDSRKNRKKQWLIVSQGFHLQRALYMAHSEGIDCWGVQAKGSMTKKMVQRELLAKTKLLLDIYVLNTQTTGIYFRQRRAIDIGAVPDCLLLLFVLSVVGMAGRLTRFLLDY